VIGELITELRADLVEEVQRRIELAGFDDVRPSHDCVFRFLGPEGIRLRELADRSRMTPQSIGEHVDELERLGYVERVPDPSDRRAKLIRPTENGLAFMAAGFRALAEIEQEWIAAVGVEALAQVSETLAAIRQRPWS
jgi:DNA-binding MarR family transcriptional regulator